MIRREFAPAKVNLFLHVGPLADDGYHPLSSWMVFADVGDELTFEPADADVLDVEGPFAGGVPTDSSNLVMKALAALRRAGAAIPPLRIGLKKVLPPASGIGGGSSDAAAVLRALGEGVEGLAQIAAAIGADVPACLRATGLIAEGRGERLGAAPTLPELHAVLVNPGVGVSTGAVFAAYDAGPAGGAAAPAMPGGDNDARGLAAWLATTRNDLEAPAIAAEPRIGEALTALAAEPEAIFSRMSGSGATVFALCETRDAAHGLAARLSAAHPAWWCVGCRLR